MAPVWTVKGGRSGEREELMLTGGLIGGGWESLSSLEGVRDRDELLGLYQAAYPDASDKKASNHVAQLWSLLTRMSERDLVVLSVKTTGTLAVGRIAGSYQYRTDLRADTRHVRPVEWLAVEVARDDFDQDLLYSFGAFLTIGQVRRENAEERVLRAIDSGRPKDVHSQVRAEPDVEVEPSPDVELLATEQVRQFIGRNFAGHDLSRLVASILEAQGFEVTLSPAGPDQGVDILAGSGALGLDLPRLVVQVKTGQADVETYRALRGTMQAFNATQGLLVAWRGFRGTLRREARPDHFAVRLWDADNLLEELGKVYERLDDNIRTELPLKRVWALVPEADEES